MKIKYDMFSDFLMEFYHQTSEIHHQRLGQAFINRFVGINDVENELFYEEDEKKALKLIFERHIELGITL